MRRAALIGGVLLIVLVAAGVVALRSGVDKFTPPTLVKPNIAQVEGGHVHAFAARLGNNILLFDTGPDNAGHALDAMLQLLNAQRSDVHDVFITHGHGDHIAGAALFPQARIWGGSSDVELAAGNASPEAFMAKVMRLVMPTSRAAIGQALDGDGQTAVGPHNELVRAFAMPGHTPGSMAYLYDGVLFVGDAAMVAEGKLVPTTAAFNPRPEEAMQSLVRLNTLLESTPIDRVCAAHGGCTAPGEGSKDLAALTRGAAADGNS